MKKQNTFAGILMIGIGIYFLLKEFNIPILTDFYSWTTILMIIGVALLLNGYIANEKDSIFPGVLLLGLGIHFHGLSYYNFWIDHWGMYLLIISLSLLLSYQKTKRGLWIGILLLIISLFSIFSSKKPGWFHWLDLIFYFIENFWPVALIIIGIYLLYFKKK